MAKYSKVYDRLITGNEFSGYIAYAFYKKHKKEFIDNYKIEHKVQEVESNDLEDFISSAVTPASLSLYRQQAEIELQKYADIIIQQRNNDIDTLNRNHEEKLKAIVEPLIPKPTSVHEQNWHSIWTNLVASFVWLIFWVLIGCIVTHNSERFATSVITVVQTLSNIPNVDQSN